MEERNEGLDIRERRPTGTKRGYGGGNRLKRGGGWGVKPN